jgi:hypothetical protein
MKKLILTIALNLPFGLLAAQQLPQVPASAFEKLDELQQKGFKIFPNYYKLQGNIDDPEGPAYAGEELDAEMALENAMNLMPYYFIVEYEGHVVSIILLKQEREGSKTNYTYLLMDTRKEKIMETKSDLNGDLTEHRAHELLEADFDPEARVKIKNSGKQKLIYQGKRYKVQTYEELLEDIDRLVEEHEFFEQFEKD